MTPKQVDTAARNLAATWGEPVTEANVEAARHEVETWRRQNPTLVAVMQAMLQKSEKDTTPPATA